MNRRSLIGMYIALLLGPAILVSGVVDYTKTRMLLTEGRIVSGTVADAKSVSGRRGSTTYHLIVTYKPTKEGPRYRKRFKVPRSIYDSASVGAEVPVRVSPSNPRIAMIGDDANGDIEKIVVGSGGFLFGIGLFWWRRPKLHLLQEIGEKIPRK